MWREYLHPHFGLLKAVVGLRQVKQRGLEHVEALFQLAMAASNLVRLPKLMAAGQLHERADGKGAPGDCENGLIHSFNAHE